MSMKNMTRLPLALALALVATGVFGPGGTVSAQAPNPCALLTKDDAQSFAANAGEGVPSTVASVNYGACRYEWGAGTDRFKLSVIVQDASRTFPGMTPDQIKQILLKSVKSETTDAVIPDIGETAVFKSDSAYYATATAFLKGRLLQVSVDGVDARDRKDQAIALLKLAASRLQP
jgi:hypothetical protein